MAGAGVLAVIDSVLAGGTGGLTQSFFPAASLCWWWGWPSLYAAAGQRALIGVAWGIFGLIEGSESLNVTIYNLVVRKKWGMDMLQAAV